MTDLLLSRDEFRESVFERDGYKCVFCENPAKDAHHIMERKLFIDGGYYLSNGASVCEEHHLACERTDISVESVRSACGIMKPKIPQHLYSDQIYDKWGNPVLTNGQRVMGELFFDESVQKVLKGYLDCFTKYIKYPRTYHLPWSDGINKDDRIMRNVNYFDGRQVVVTEKVDGECSTLYNDYTHARSVDGRSHPSRDRLKSIWGSISHNIPDDWRLCGENMYAKHSIAYSNLESYFLAFSIWNKDKCLSWEDSLEWFELIGVSHVPVMYMGLYNEDKIKSLYNEKTMYSSCEGYVVRLADEFSYSEFQYSVGKFVRRNHVSTDRHWMRGRRIEPNALKEM